MIGQQDLAQLSLPALNGALDLIRLEQRSIRVHRDFEFASRGLVNIVGECHQVLAVEIASGVSSGQVPLGLGRCAKRKGGCSHSDCNFEVHKKLRQKMG